MSEPITTARGARFEGPDVSVAEAGPVGMINIRGDFEDPAFAEAVRSVTGAALPGRRRFAPVRQGGLGWMSPDELLYLTAYGEAPEASRALGEALAGRHHLAANVSDARAVFRIFGLGARELIAKGAPVDLAPAAFGPGDLRRTRLGQVAAAFWMGDDGAFTLVCFRSVGAYVFDWLKTSAASGARPGMF